MSENRLVSAYLLPEALVFAAFTEHLEGGWGSNEYVTRVEIPTDDVAVGEAMLDALFHSGDPRPEKPKDPRGFRRLYDVAKVKSPAALARKAQCIHVASNRAGVVSLTPMKRAPRGGYINSELRLIDGLRADDAAALGRELMKLFEALKSLN